MSFGSNLKKYRIKAGLTQLQLAKRLNVRQTAVSNWEGGIRQPKLDDLADICRELKVDRSFLLAEAPSGDLAIFRSENEVSAKIPLFISRVSAGFPSPADGYIEKKLNLTELLVKNEDATFFVRVQGTSMIDARIHEGDILVVDRSKEPKSGSIIIAVLDGEFTVKRIDLVKKKLYLIPENPEYKPIEITEERDFVVWGVVTSVIHSV